MTQANSCEPEHLNTRIPEYPNTQKTEHPTNSHTKGTLMTVHSPQLWKDLATQLRADSIRSTTAAGSGHPTSSMSAADLMAVLLSEHLHYDFDNPHDLCNDRLIFSKGHAAPLLYALYKAAGAISDEEMLTLRKLGC